VDFLALKSDSGAYHCVSVFSSSNCVHWRTIKVPTLSSRQDRNTAYAVLMQFVGNAKPDTPMPADVARAARLLKDADDEVLLAMGRTMVSQLQAHLRTKLSEEQRQRIKDFNIRVSASSAGVPQVDRRDKVIFVPVDFLHDVWVVTMAFEEMESLDTQRMIEVMVYLGLRLNPSSKAKSGNLAFNAMGASMAVQGKHWPVTRDRWNEALARAYQGVKGAVFHSVAHEICHELLQHQEYSAIPRNISTQQEKDADRCGWDLLPDHEVASFNPMGAVLALHVRTFNEAGEIVVSQTHPPAICRAYSLSYEALRRKSIVQSREDFLDQIVGARLPNFPPSTSLKDIKQQVRKVFLDYCG
jgi:hypothetical protein